MALLGVSRSRIKTPQDPRTEDPFLFPVSPSHCFLQFSCLNIFQLTLCKLFLYLMDGPTSTVIPLILAEGHTGKNIQMLIQSRYFLLRFKGNREKGYVSRTKWERRLCKPL